MKILSVPNRPNRGVIRGNTGNGVISLAISKKLEREISVTHCTAFVIVGCFTFDWKHLPCYSVTPSLDNSELHHWFSVLGKISTTRQLNNQIIHYNDYVRWFDKAEDACMYHVYVKIMKVKLLYNELIMKSVNDLKYTFTHWCKKESRKIYAPA